MTRDEKLQAIRAKVVEANPEIVQLKYGCLIDCKLWGRQMIVDKWKDASGEGWCLVNPDYPGRSSCSTSDENIIKVYGRPIRLADVLLAHRLRFPADGTTRTNESFMRHHTGQFREDIWEIALLWNLREDDLSRQPDETIDFLHSLLCL